MCGLAVHLLPVCRVSMTVEDNMSKCSAYYLSKTDVLQFATVKYSLC